MHIAQQMPMPLTISCSSKSRLVLTFLVLPFWYLLTRVVPDIFQKSSETVVCVLQAQYRGVDYGRILLGESGFRFGETCHMTFLLFIYLGLMLLMLFSAKGHLICQHTHAQPFYSSLVFVRDSPGELVPEVTFRHLLDLPNESESGVTLKLNPHLLIE